MKMPVIMSLSLILSALLVGEPRSAHSEGSPSDSCKLVEKALEDVRHIKAGMTRQELEKHFERDGGVQFQTPTRYWYPACHYIKIDVKFKMSASPRRNELLSPNDTVEEVSKPYLEYPARD